MSTLSLIKADDFARIAPLLGPCELVKGEIVHRSPGGFRHSRVTMNIGYLLETYCRRTKLGRTVTNEVGIVVKRDPDTVRGADVLYISYDRLPASEEWVAFLQHKPELVVEVLGADDTWKRIEEKIADYHAFGVEMVWVAEPQTRAVRLYPRDGTPQVLHEADELKGEPWLPGFACKVAEFFQD